MKGLRKLGFDRVDAARPAGLREHAHGGAIEIGYLRDGQVDWWSRDTRGRPVLAEVSAGEAFVTRPWTPHGGLGGVLQPCELFWAVIEPEAVGAGLTKALRSIERPALAVPPTVGESFGRLIQEHRHPDRPHAAEAAGAALAAIAVEVVRAASTPAAAAASLPVWRALQWVERAPPQAGVPEMAEAAGLSVGRLHARLRQELSLTPAGLLRRRRMTAAKHLLAGTPLPVTQVALACGFASGQSFATAFRRAAGMTPAGYRYLVGRGSVEGQGGSLELHREDPDEAGEAL